MPDPFKLANIRGFKLEDLNHMYQEALRDKNIRVVTAIMAEFRRREAEAQRRNTAK